MSVEAWKSLCDIGTVVALFLAFAFGVGVWSSGNIINAKQSTQLRQFDKDLTGAKTELAMQQQKASEFEIKAARLEIEAAGLRKQLRTQESRAALLMEAGSQKRFLKIEPFRDQKVQVAQCGRQDNEVSIAVMTISNLLRVRGWKVDPFNPYVPCSTGIRVIVRHDAPSSTSEAAKALGAVLSDLGLMTGIKEPFTRLPEAKAGEEQSWNPPDAETVLVVVLIHP